ncbi:hypothetical protein D3C80_1151270 [compost metagenome]
MGDHLVRRRSAAAFLLQHHSDPGRRHARGGSAHRVDQGPEELRRTDTEQARQGHHHRRRDDLGCRHAFGLYPRTGIRRPDQGQARHRRGSAACRKRAARSVRPLSRRQSQRSGKAARLGDRTRRRAPSPPQGKRSQPQDGGAQVAPARQACRLLAEYGRGCRTVHCRGRLGWWLCKAGPQPNQSGHSSVARQNPQRRFGKPRKALRQPADCRSHSGARLRHAVEIS